jgi:ParB-like chromosome segregation protein Spo0J
VKFNGEIHPVAAMFPMLAADELQELADDIKANGQVQPIMLDACGQLIDGRNRLAACKLAKVDPVFDHLEKDRDPVAYILSTNVARRHLSKGQRAMAVARAADLLNKSAGMVEADAAQVSKPYIAQANTVLRYAPDIADAVLGGASTLAEAYKVAQDRKKAADTTEARMAQIRDEAPDLAALIDEDRMSFNDAWAALERRRADHVEALNRERRRLVALIDGWTQLQSLPQHPFRDELLAGLNDTDASTVLNIEAVYLKGTR